MFNRFNADDRVVMMFAMQEAADLGHRGLGNDHLILGMLGNARSPLFSLLGEQGLTLDSARDTVRAFHDEHADELADDGSGSATDRYDEDREALKSIGIDLDKVREAVRDRFGEDMTDGWGERRGRGRDGRGRGRGHGPDCDGPHGRRHGGPDGRRGGPQGRGGRRGGPDREGFGPRGFGPGGFGPGDTGQGWGPGGFGPGPGADDEGPWEGGRGRRGPRGRRGGPRMSGSARDALRAAVGYARDRGDRTIVPEYVLLGILDTDDAASHALIASATTADDLRAAVLASLPETPVDA
ncbi:MAG: Clp protease N-terminal domain-containing protein [Gordonia sp. (in: high G+C Gram-positive bacteria)]|uniref:Clp protease N-terminal domain-containing protein n=1 Tax=Gordonia sp. (in: high G+C Gram-positive bacteria) TaxID=84139 RepID=UPI0039E65DBC